MLMGKFIAIKTIILLVFAFPKKKNYCTCECLQQGLKLVAHITGTCFSGPITRQYTPPSSLKPCFQTRLFCFNIQKSL